METREIYRSIWKNCLLGLLGVLFGGAMLYISQGNHTGMDSQYIIPIGAWLFLLAGIFIIVITIWQRIAHRPYLRLTQDALEVFVDIRKGYESYPWKQIKDMEREVVQNNTYIVLSMYDKFLPTIINPNGYGGKFTTQVLGSPYAILCNSLPYRSDELQGILYDYWQKYK